jgi:hypothetical protein
MFQRETQEIKNVEEARKCNLCLSLIELRRFTRDIILFRSKNKESILIQKI